MSREWNGAIVVALIGLVAVVGTVFVSRGPQSAAVYASNPGYRSYEFDPSASYCDSQEECGPAEVCAPARAPRNFMRTCQPSHECGRDADCSGLGYTVTQMACVDGWCVLRE